MITPFKNIICFKLFSSKFEKTKEKIEDERIFTVFYNDEEVYTTSALKENIEELSIGFLKCYALIDLFSDIKIAPDHNTGIIDIRSKERKNIKILPDMNIGKFIHLKKNEKILDFIDLRTIKTSKTNNNYYNLELSYNDKNINICDIRELSAFFKIIGFSITENYDLRKSVIIFNKLPSTQIIYLIYKLKIPVIILKNLLPTTLIMELAKKIGVELASIDRLGRYTIYTNLDFFKF